ncbi:MAG: hypothetical protein ACLP9Y_05495 [Mycobacterium sp.]
MTPPETKPLLAVGFCDVGVVLTTRGGAQVIIPAHDATDLADALVDAVEAFHAHHSAHAG